MSGAIRDGLLSGGQSLECLDIMGTVTVELILVGLCSAFLMIMLFIMCGGDWRRRISVSDGSRGWTVLPYQYCHASRCCSSETVMCCRGTDVSLGYGAHAGPWTSECLHEEGWKKITLRPIGEMSCFCKALGIT